MGLIFAKLWRFFCDQEHKVIIVGLDNAGKTTIFYQFLMNEVVHTSPTIGSNVEEIVVKNTHFLMWDIGGQESLRSSWNTYYSNTEIFYVKLISNLFEKSKNNTYITLPHSGATSTLQAFAIRSLKNCIEVSFTVVVHTDDDQFIKQTFSSSISVMSSGVLSFIILVVDSIDRERLSITKEELYRMLAHEDLRKAAVLIFANKQDVKGCMTAGEISKYLTLSSIKDHPWHIQSCCALTGEGLCQGLEWMTSHIGVR